MWPNSAMMQSLTVLGGRWHALAEEQKLAYAPLEDGHDEQPAVA